MSNFIQKFNDAVKGADLLIKKRGAAVIDKRISNLKGLIKDQENNYNNVKRAKEKIREIERGIGEKIIDNTIIEKHIGIILFNDENKTLNQLWKDLNDKTSKCQNITVSKVEYNESRLAKYYRVEERPSIYILYHDWKMSYYGPHDVDLLLETAHCNSTGDKIFREGKDFVGGGKKGGGKKGGGSKKSETHTLTLYYAFWCPHCKVVIPEFIKLLKMKKKGDRSLKNVIINRVKCDELSEDGYKYNWKRDKTATQDCDAPKKHNIQGYPTIHFNDIEYNGERSAKSILKYIKTQLS
jgi:thiol-disulfide isomerase/thioredoxin